jgi:acyl-CoA synthetase (NDP forming)
MADLEYIFHPRSVAVVGASPHSTVTEMFLDPLIQFGYPGKIYPVHPRASEVSGLKAYPSLMDIPGPVDLVTCAIKAASTPELMRQCVAKGVRLVQMFTSGFSETGEERGILLEKEIVAIAREGNVRILGPNCMGIYYPRLGIAYEPFLPRESGAVAALAQSGGNSIMLVMAGAARGIRFSKVVSFGNACDINESDLLDYFAADAETRIIIGYIEGTRDGRRFIRALHEAAKVKPVIFLKGGTSEAGTRAVASHTGSLAGNKVVWESVFSQCGAVQAAEIDEVIDVALLFQHLQPPQGRKVGLVGLGGGNSVLVTDSCAREDLVVPLFPQELIAKLREILPADVDPGTSVRNPVDLSLSGWNPEVMVKTLEAVDRYPGVDIVLVYINLHAGVLHPTLREWTMGHMRAFAQARRALRKPVLLAIQDDRLPEVTRLSFEVQEVCHAAGIPVFPSFNRAARALNLWLRYYERRCS